ncbi:hypothetical protein [Paraglaciecola sp.]|uniref:hypothetical protein n=1 Tax=Paraglaciecola sp. TaxID=1920173 RepID=UPI003EF6A57D
MNAQQVNKSSPIRMSALSFPGVVQINHTGLFDLLVEHVNSRAGIDMDYQVLVPARGARKFYDHEADCIIPGTLLDAYYEGYDVISTNSFETVEFVAFTKSPTPRVVNKDQLEGKVIGIIRDEGKWNLKKRLRISNAKYIELVDIRSLLGMLTKGRIDAIVHDVTIVSSAIEHFNVENIVYDINSPILVDDLGIVCHRSSDTSEYIRKFNIELKEILEGDGLVPFYRKVKIEH